MSSGAVQTHFSLGRSILKPKKIAEKVKELGYETLTVCDLSSLSSMTDIVSACTDQDLSYIIGVTVPVYADAVTREKSKPIYAIKLYAKDEVGLKTLFKLLSYASSKERFYYNPRLQRSDITDFSADGLVFSTGDLESVLSYPKYQDELIAFITHFGRLHSFVEFVAVEQIYFDRVNKVAESVVRLNELRSMVTRPVLYLEEQADVRDMALAISNNSDPNHSLASRPVTRDFHLHSKSDYNALLIKLNLSQFDNASQFESLFTYRWEKQHMSLPKLAVNESSELIKLCKEGWADRIANPVFGEVIPPTQLTEYKERLKYELTIINKMGFEPYFLLVAYVCQWSKTNEVLVGPARGSAAGSLVAYLLKITDVDPLRFGLIFERFLNPDRLDYPDIDLDFMSSKRNDIIDHLIEKFGRDKVAGISNYNSLGSASALRDVGRISGLPAFDYECSKLVPKEHGQNVSLEEAVEQVTEIENYALKYPKHWANSLALQGVVRSMGQHAAGIVVAGEPIINRAVVAENKEYPVVNWDKRIVEDWGLIKLDVLGLSTLDIIDIAVRKINEGGGKLDLWQIPLTDEKVLAVFAEGRTKGVFQFEGHSARNLCRDVAASGTFSFEDIVAINALNRPGPLEAGLTQKYVKIRQGKFSPEYPHPKTRPALEETESVIVYQEQVMQIARDLSGFTMAEADTLRKAIGKKSADLMKTMSEKFIKGAMDNGMVDIDANLLWDQIEGFAAYSFNKSHSCAYSLISYMMAYLKAYHASEFYAATMTVLDDDKVKSIAKDAISDGLLILPPDVNISTNKFEIGYDAKRCKPALYAPLNSIKNISNNVANHIIECRNTDTVDDAGKVLHKSGPFTNFANFEARTQARKCNKRAKSNLTLVGAFASIEPDQIDPLHPDRLRDQKELMNAVSVANVKPDRVIDLSPTVRHKLDEMYVDMASTGPVVSPNSGARPKFVVITDKPTYFEIEAGTSFKGKSDTYFKQALKHATLKPSEGYFTHLVKRQPESSKKEISKEEIAYFGSYLRQELEILKPPLVLLAGTKSIRYFFPDIKGSAEDLSGSIEYNKELDCSFLFCINPQMIYIKPEKQELLNKVFCDIAELLDVA
jgi:DNA polymerase-3 subunit alpha